MSDAWRRYLGAPAPGRQVCALADLADGSAHCVELDGFPLLLVQVAGRLRAYVNACPHQYLPLNHRGNKLLSSDRTILRCTNHGAGFNAETGAGVEGLGIGDCLDPVPVAVIDGIIHIGSAASPL